MDKPTPSQIASSNHQLTAILTRQIQNLSGQLKRELEAENITALKAIVIALRSTADIVKDWITATGDQSDPAHHDYLERADRLAGKIISHIQQIEQ